MAGEVETAPLITRITGLYLLPETHRPSFFLPLPWAIFTHMQQPLQRVSPGVLVRQEGGPSPRTATNWLVGPAHTAGSQFLPTLPAIPSTLGATSPHELHIQPGCTLLDHFLCYSHRPSAGLALQQLLRTPAGHALYPQSRLLMRALAIKEDSQQLCWDEWRLLLLAD